MRPSASRSTVTELAVLGSGRDSTNLMSPTLGRRTVAEWGLAGSVVTVKRAAEVKRAA